MDQTQIDSSTASVKSGVHSELSGFKDLLVKSFKLYEALFKKVVILALISIVAMLPLILVSMALGYMGSQYAAIKIILGVIFVVSFILLIYFGSAAQAATLLLLEDRDRSIGELFKKGISMAWPVIVVGFLTGLFTLLWTLLLIIPGIIFSIYYSFSMYALIYENKTGIAAIKRSQQLVKNYWWAVFNRTMLLFIVYLAAFAVVSLPIYFLPEESVLAIFWNMVLSALRFITSPVFVIFAYFIYKELINIKGSEQINVS